MMSDGMSEPPLSAKTGSSLTESVPDKVVLVGDVGVGKTSLFLRFKTGQFQQATPSHNPRDGEYQKEWTVGAAKVSMTLFDTAGIERHMSTIPPTYFRWSKVVMLVYSIDDSDTFDSLTGWSENAISTRVGGETLFVLVGNKLDLASERTVQKSRAVTYASNIDVHSDMVFEVSALTGEGVDHMFNTIAAKMGPVPLQALTLGGGNGEEGLDGGRWRKNKCCTTT